MIKVQSHAHDLLQFSMQAIKNGHCYLVGCCFACYKTAKNVYTPCYLTRSSAGQYVWANRENTETNIQNEAFLTIDLRFKTTCC